LLVVVDVFVKATLVKIKAAATCCLRC